MKPSQKIVDFIKFEEKLVLKAYLCPAKVWTIGYGATRYPDGKPVKQGEVISMERAEDLLRRDLERRSIGITKLLGDTVLNQNQFDALVSFEYNCGYYALASSTLLRKVKSNPGDPTIRDEFYKWNKITKDGQKVALKGLTLRRKREADLYFSH